LIGSNAKQLAYQLERKLFDTGHAPTVLENSNDGLANALKNAGWLCLCANEKSANSDLAFDCGQYNIDKIYEILKQRGVIR
jgi:bifunctional enzyme CysN/CysC